MMESPERENTSMTPPGRRFGNLKLSGLISTSVFSTCALAGKGTTRSKIPPSESENSAQSFKSCSTAFGSKVANTPGSKRSEEHTSELQSPDQLVCRLL